MESTVNNPGRKYHLESKWPVGIYTLLHQCFVPCTDGSVGISLTLCALICNFFLAFKLYISHDWQEKKCNFIFTVKKVFLSFCTYLSYLVRLFVCSLFKTFAFSLIGTHFHCCKTLNVTVKIPELSVWNGIYVASNSDFTVQGMITFLFNCSCMYSTNHCGGNSCWELAFS